MDAPKYPRVLILGESFDQRSGGGITLTNLFRDWPSESLAAAAEDLGSVDWDTCGSYYSLGSDESRYRWPLSVMQRSVASGAVAQSRESDQGSGLVGAPSKNRARPAFVRDFVRMGLRLTAADDRFRLLQPSDGFWRWAESFRPDVVYSQLSAMRLMNFVGAVVGRLETPLVIHIMDDWPSTIYHGAVGGGSLRAAADSVFAGLVTDSAGALAISPLMAADYGMRYGRPFRAFHNPVDLGQWRRHAKIDWSVGEPFTILYAGRVGRGNADAVAEVARAVGRLRGLGRNISFALHTQDADEARVRRIGRLDGVQVGRADLPYRDVPALLSGADALVLPQDFEGDGLRFTHLSMPTKVPEYMASGAPMLVYAPRGSAVAEYARASQFGLLVDCADFGSLESALERLMDEPQLRESLAKKAMKVSEEHDAVVVRERFRLAIQEAADAAVG